MIKQGNFQGKENKIRQSSKEDKQGIRGRRRRGREEEERRRGGGRGGGGEMRRDPN